MAPSLILRLHAADPVGIALVDLPVGTVIAPGIVARDAIPRGHKVALAAVESGAPVTKFGTFIGVAAQPIAPGDHVHSHNLAFRPSPPTRDVRLARRNARTPEAPIGATFQGYRRDDGRIGTRNVLLVLATVNCSATVAKRIAEQFRREVDLSATPTIDGVVALTHQHGCSFRADGPGMAILRRTLGGYARHPNVAGTLVVGLGCEDNQVDEFLAAAGLTASDRLTTRVIQQEGGTAATVAAGVDALKAMLPRAAAAVRTTVPASHLVVGLQCGGSDGFSAISANPALGLAADRLVAEGGTVILSETPEIYGAEQLLLERAATEQVADRLRSLLVWWDTNARRDDGTLDNNPSPGNKQGGITTILEKSLGAVSKGGSSPLNAVYDYAEPITDPGLVFMDSPGYDPVAATGQVASGANLICFTTGRGSCFGCAPVPSLKIATTSGLFRRMAGDMDLDAGPILDGTMRHDAVGEAIFARMLATASGARTVSESLGYGEEEFIPWAQGLLY